MSTKQTMYTIVMSVVDQGLAIAGQDKRRRRSWSADDKRRILAEAAQPGASVSMTARRHDMNANPLFTWRRGFAGEGGHAAELPPAFIPAVLAGPTDVPTSSATSGRMEIVLATGHCVVVSADVDAAALLRVVQILERR